MLVVDDEADIRTIAEICLSRVGGWRILLAPDGASALQIACADPPDVILLDVMMPILDGPATLARLRADPRTAAIPVVFLTARIRRGDQEGYRAMGAAGAIPKPFHPLKLAEEIRRIVEGE